jgi:hypothetical protein
MAIIKKIVTTDAGEDVGKRSPYSLLVGINPAPIEISMESPQKLKIGFPYDPAIPLLGVHPKESKPAYYTDTHIRKYYSTFPIVKLCNQPVDR